MFTFKTVSLVFFIRSFGAIAALLMTAIVAKKLELAEAGYFFWAFTTVTILIPVSLFGAQLTSLRLVGSAYASKNWKEISEVILVTASVALCVSMLVSTLIWLVSSVISENFMGGKGRELLKNIALALPFMSLSVLLAHYLQGIRKILSSVVILSIFIPLLITTSIIFLDLHSAVDISYWLVISAIINLLISVSIILRSVTFKKPDSAKFKPIIRICFPFWIITVMTIIIPWGGQLIAVFWVKSEEIALLTVAQRISGVLGFILVSINYIVSPLFATYYKQNKFIEIETLAYRSVKGAIIIASPIVLLLLLFPERALSLFGTQFTQGSHLLIILTIAQVFNIITGSVGPILNMSKYEREVRNLVLISGTVTIFLSFSLIPFYGITGAAIASATGVIFQNLGAAYITKKKFGFNILKIWKNT